MPVSGADFRRCCWCLASLEKFFPSLGPVSVIFPDVEAQVFQALPKRFSFVRLIPESDVLLQQQVSWLHRLAGRYQPSCVGWYRQQILKLGFARLAQSDFYLTMDADILCTRATRVGDLFCAGKARVVRHEMCHWWWYRISAWVLGMTTVSEEYSITPVLFRTATATELLAHLGGGREAHHPQWIRRLGNAVGWTEYSLYFTFLENQGRLRDYYLPIANDDWFGPCAWSDWLPGNPFWVPEEVFSATRPGGPFSLLSSRVKVPLDTLEKLLAPYLDGLRV